MSNTEPVIVANMIRTPDGTILQSKHRHDYVEYIDKNGLEYMVDGGCEYLRRTIQDEAPYEELSLYAHDDHMLVRKHFHWGTRGRDGRQPLTYKPLKTLDYDHIEAIIKTQTHISNELKIIFIRELRLRDAADPGYGYL
jgi:hypothetical protein